MNLPPQAYTKEMLIQAYNWLRSQPAHVQEMAKSPDALVSLYSKAQIHGENYLSRTNLQSFKSELKNLAHIMGDLEDNTHAPPPPHVPQAAVPPQQATASATGALGAAQNKTAMNSTANKHTPPGGNSSNPMASSPSSLALTNGGNSPYMTPMITDPNLPLFNSLMNLPPEPELKSLLDARSWGMIQEIKNHLNLSSETEALRLLIALGYQKIRPQF